jgi:hypothetical protein
MSEYAFYMTVANVIAAIFVWHYRFTSLRLQRERDLSRDYASMLEAKYNAALAQLDQRLVLYGHIPDPERVPVHKYTVLVTNGYTAEGAFIVLTISSDQPRVLPRALAAVVVNASPLQEHCRS